MPKVCTQCKPVDSSVPSASASCSLWYGGCWKCHKLLLTRLTEGSAAHKYVTPSWVLLVSASKVSVGVVRVLSSVLRAFAPVVAGLMASSS